MGLVEKRLMAQLRDAVVPQYQNELQSITGSPLVYQVEWDTFVDNKAAMDKLEKALQTINAIFQEIAIDTIGKEAIASAIKQVHLSQGGPSNISDFTLVNGILDLPWDWVSWGGSFYPSSVREKIEQML